MKMTSYVGLALLLCLSLAGCGDKTAGIEGKVIDGQGKPLSGISVIFKQVQPTQGYEHFETRTGPDGTFRLTGIAPSSDYVISFLTDKWNTRVTQKVKTSAGGENLLLGAPISCCRYYRRERH